MKRKNDFLECYSKVFALNGEITKCGRDVCIDLICKCLELDDSGVDYGNVSTGFINIETVKQLVAKKFPAIIFRETYLSRMNDEHYLNCFPEEEVNSVISFNSLISCGLLSKDSAKLNKETIPVCDALTQLIENCILVRDYL